MDFIIAPISKMKMRRATAFRARISVTGRVGFANGKTGSLACYGGFYLRTLSPPPAQLHDASQQRHEPVRNAEVAQSLESSCIGRLEHVAVSEEFRIVGVVVELQLELF